MDHDKIEAVLKRLGMLLSKADLPPIADAGIEQAANLIRDLRTEIGRLETAKVSIDVSTRDDDAGHRVFGLAIDRQTDADGSIRLLCEYESDNFGMRADAALIAGVPALVEAANVLLEEAENFSVSGVYFNEDCMGHKGPALVRAALASIGRKPE